MCNKKGTFRFSSGNTRGMANEGYLPREMWADILTRLPAKVVGQCKCICKHWCAVIEDSSFVELHHFRAKSRAGGCHLVISSGDCDFRNTSFFSADYGGGLAQHLFRCSISDSSDMEAPVNGLICGYNCGAKSIFIVNPITKEVISLPPFSLPSCSYSGVYFKSSPLVAFGFDPSTKQYKVLHIDRVKKEDTHGNLEFFHCECEVFTLGTHSWRKIDVAPASQFEFGCNGICLGGVIHWRNFSTGESSRPVDEVVVAFDLKDEIFRVISLPRGPSRMPLLVEVGGHLAACQEYPESENEPEELWILEDYDNWVWVQERIMLSPTYIPRPAGDLIHTNGSIQTGEILLHTPLPPRSRFPVLEIYYYSRKKRSLRKIDIAGVPKSDFMHVFNCVENLLSLRDI